jgi:3-oxoacyl-[acyl-carrier protein] reductase
MADTLSLENKVALVTGGSRGIGRAVALELAARGAAVVVNYNKSSEAADEVVKKIQEAGGKAAAFQADVSDFKQADALVKFAIETFGDLTILVNNAGITKDTLIMMMSEADWDSVINTNLKSTFNCSKAAVKHMMRKRTGRIINMASIAGQMGNPGQTNYSASKGGRLPSPSHWREVVHATSRSSASRQVCRYRNSAMSETLEATQTGPWRW